MAEKGFLLSHARVSNKRHRGIKSDDIFSLFQQLSTMISAGMPLMDALQLTAAQTQSKKLGIVMGAICKKVPRHRLHVDHDHRTKKVRRLLCRLCNAGLGCFKDDLRIVRRAAAKLSPPISASSMARKRV